MHRAILQGLDFSLHNLKSIKTTVFVFQNYFHFTVYTKHDKNNTYYRRKEGKEASKGDELHKKEIVLLAWPVPWKDYLKIIQLYIFSL